MIIINNVIKRGNSYEWKSFYNHTVLQFHWKKANDTKCIKKQFKYLEIVAVIELEHNEKNNIYWMRNGSVNEDIYGILSGSL